MGNAASRVYGTLVRRPLQRFNVDHRAEKEINKFQDQNSAPVRAPMYQSDADLLAEIRNTNPEMAESAVRKDGELHTRLKSVYVESSDPELEPTKPNRPARPLPRDTSQYSYDFVPAQFRLDTKDRLNRVVPRGKVSLEQAVDFLTRYKKTEGTFDHIAIADQYRLSPETTKQAVRYFTVFKMMETNTRESETTPPDPLMVGEGWVEKVKNPQDPFGEQKDEKERILATLERHKDRVAKEKMLGDGRTE
jgi:hypothetical protein